jgi:putative acetyltransferase
MRIERLAPESEAAQALIALSDEYMESLYPSESNHLESIAALQASNNPGRWGCMTALVT